jgi:hypothetical protein
MIPAEAFPGTFVTLKGACGKTTTTVWTVNSVISNPSKIYIRKDPLISQIAIKRTPKTYQNSVISLANWHFYQSE